MSENQDNTTAEDSQPQTSRPAARARQRTMLVRYGKMGMIGEFQHSEREIPSTASHVVLRTERGMEIGSVISPYFHSRGTCDISNEHVEQYCQAHGPGYPLSLHGHFIRYATEQDLNEQRHLEHSAAEEIAFCRELIKKHDLAMKLVDIEHLFGGDRIIFYFMAEGRVDFRQLVRQLGQQYQTRIEMRQIGARDEARLVADLETCGRQCCCKNFLKMLQPVNMRMAKVQKATLDPSKISGRCGRLKCCLRYEDKVYTELAKNLPRKNTCVLTDQGHGTVLDGQIITQLVKLRLASGRIIAVSVDDITERDYQPPPPDEKTEQRNGTPPVRQGSARQGSARQGSVRQGSSRQGSARQDAARQTTSGERASESASAQGPPDGAAPKKRRRRRRKKKNNAPGGSVGPNSPSS